MVPLLPPPEQTTVELDGNVLTPVQTVKLFHFIELLVKHEENTANTGTDKPP